MRREDYSDEDWGNVLCDRWDRLSDLHAQGVIDEHPGKAQWNADSAVLRAASVGKDGLPGNVGSSKEIEAKPSDPSLDAYDDPPDTPGTPRPPDRAGANLAGDLALEELRIRQRASATMDSELHAMRLRRSDPRKIAGMSRGIAGYDRLK